MPTTATKRVSSSSLSSPIAKTPRGKKGLQAPPPPPFPMPTPGVKLKHFLITQPQPEGDKSPYFDIAKKYKVTFTFRPFNQIEGISTKEFRRYRINLGSFTSVIFTSRNAIEHFFRISQEMKMPMSAETKYFCMTESIGLYLQKFILYRKRKVFYGDGSMKDFRNIILKHKEGEKYFFPVSDQSNTDITGFLKDNGFDYTESVLFRSVPIHIKDLEIGKYDAMVFFSPANVSTLVKAFPKAKRQHLYFGGFGANTCNAIKDAGLKLEIEAPQAGHPSMASAIEYYLRLSK